MAEKTYPAIADYHCGPYEVAVILRDPGREEVGCGAVTTGQVGVRNYEVNRRDQTAKTCHEALLMSGLPLSAYLPLNAVPWYNGDANLASIKEGAGYNAELLRLHGVRRVILLGGEAKRSRRYLEALLDGMTFTELPHPGTRGIMSLIRNGTADDYPSAKRIFLSRFSEALRG